MQLQNRKPLHQGHNLLFRYSGIHNFRFLSEPAALPCHSSENEHLFPLQSSLGMEETAYGLIHADKMTFEAFDVEKVVSPVSLKLRETLQEEFRENAPIMRIVHGRTDAQGNYLLRVRDDGTNLKYLVRYVVSGKPQFQVVDFHQPETQLK